MTKVKAKSWAESFAVANAPRRMIRDIKIGPRHRKDMGDVVGLAKSIDARGALLEPIVIDAKNVLIDGQRRMVAWPLTKLSDGGRLPIPVSIVDIDSIVAGEYDANTQRKDFTPSETVAIKRALEPAEKEAARSRQAHGGTAKGRKADTKTAEGRAADKVAKVVGRGRRTIEKAEAVVAAAERDPEKFGKLQADMDRTGRVHGPYKRLQVMTQGAQLRKEPPPLPGRGPYRGVMIDFPWPAEQDDPDPVASGRAYYPYPTLSIDGIVAFAERARAILHDDAVVGVWITNFHLVNGHHVPVLAALGLKPVTMRTWVKDRIGQGHVLRGQTEHMIIGTRGSPTIEGASISTFFHAAAGKLHSQKPAKAYEDFERLVPAARYASLFHVGELPANWDGHGDELAVLGTSSGDDQHVAEAALEPKTLLDMLELIEAGGSPALYSMDEPIRVLRNQIDSQKLAKKAGAGVLRSLTKRGEAKLSELREKRRQQGELAELPTTIDDLIADYSATLSRFHQAIVTNNQTDCEREERRLELLQIKANGGDSFGMGCEDSQAEQLRAGGRAELGSVPLWAQPGIFRIEIDGTPYLISIGGTVAGDISDFGAYAVDPDKLCISKTGFQSIMGDFWHFAEDAKHRWPMGETVDAYCIRKLREEIAERLETGTGKRRRKPEGLSKPETVYRMPATWEESSYGDPVEQEKLSEAAE